MQQKVRQSLLKKQAVVRELVEKLNKYKYFMLLDFSGIGSHQFQLIRKQLRGRAELKVVKNTLLRRALEQSDKKNVLEVENGGFLTGQNCILFTDVNPFELALFLEKNKVPAPARPGDIAPEDIYVPAGNTGLPAGPILGKMGKLKIPTKIEEGTIFIVRDTKVVSKGEVIDEDVAEILGQLGIHPIKVGLKIKYMYVDGTLLSKDAVPVPDEYKEMISKAHQEAFALAVNAALPIPDVLRISIQQAYARAIGLASSVPIPSKDAIVHALRKAYYAALALKRRIEGG